MNASVIDLSLPGLVIAFLPTLVVFFVLWRWKAGVGTAAYATVRMLAQLLIIGYVLIFVFTTEHVVVIAAVILVMVVAAAAIAIRPLRMNRRRAYRDAVIAIAITGLGLLVVVTRFAIGVEPWFTPRYIVPLAGMTFAATMNAVSLAAERFAAERSRDASYEDARRQAITAAMLPVVNSLFAVGLVSLPGMMTGQVLSGVSPLIAAQYQIVVMAMLFGAAGMSAAIYLTLQRSAA